MLLMSRARSLATFIVVVVALAALHAQSLPTYVVDPAWAGGAQGSLPRDLPADLPVEWFGVSRVDHTVWDEFYRRYSPSDGWTRFERASLSRDGRSATVRVTHSYGGLSGSAWLVSLTKQDDGWRVVKTSVLANA